jgi:Flp pilus assembly pilin Flp
MIAETGTLARRVSAALISDEGNVDSLSRACILFLARDLAVAVHRRDRAQGLMEYGLILAMVSVFAILALFVVGDSLSTVLSNVHHTMQQCVSGGSCTAP